MDNLNVMLYTLEKSEEAESMLVSLDAEKAFDSVEHWYIRKVLEKIGLTEFVKIFDVIYRNQNVNILLNGNQAGKYNIKNGVKQGDALSCILFILSVEPLLQNMNKDDMINGIKINDNIIPKAVAYADDIACLIQADQSTLQKIFDHYEDLTKFSGLKLNADKTEIISNGKVLNYNIIYGGSTVEIKVQPQIKVNGLVLSYDVEVSRKQNILNMLEAVEKQLNGWYKRNLSLLGKIQIFKTFGLSQILYTLTSIQMNRIEDQMLTNIIYKFIWNRNPDANKAPDRIKRKI